MKSLKKLQNKSLEQENNNNNNNAIQFKDLPVEILSHIFSFLEISDIPNIVILNKESFFITHAVWNHEQEKELNKLILDVKTKQNKLQQEINHKTKTLFKVFQITLMILTILTTLYGAYCAAIFIKSNISKHFGSDGLTGSVNRKKVLLDGIGPAGFIALLDALYFGFGSKLKKYLIKPFVQSLYALETNKLSHQKDSYETALESLKEDKKFIATKKEEKSENFITRFQLLNKLRTKDKQAITMPIAKSSSTESKEETLTLPPVTKSDSTESAASFTSISLYK